MNPQQLFSAPGCGRLRALILWLSFGLFSLSTGNTSGEVSAVLTPDSTSSAFNTPLLLHVTGLAPGEAVTVERFIDADANGVIDADTCLAERFVVTDGLMTAIGGVRNPSIPGDEDATVDGEISVHLSPGQGPELGRLAGVQIIRVASPQGAFAALICPLAITHLDQPQSIIGTVTDGTNPVPFARVIAFDTGLGGEFALGTVADAAGSYTIDAPAAAYTVVAFKTGYVSVFDQTPTVILGGGNTFTQDLQLVPATTSISGTVTDASTGAGIGGVQVFAWSQSGLTAVTSTDYEGRYSVAVTGGQWQIQISGFSLRRLGYLTLGAKTDAAADATSAAVANVNIRVPKVTALIHGTVADSGAKPVAGIGLGANDSDHIYRSEAITDANGHYVLGVTTGLWDAFISSNSVFSVPDRQTVAITGAEAVRADFLMGAVNVTGMIPTGDSRNNAVRPPLRSTEVTGTTVGAQAATPSAASASAMSAAPVEGLLTIPSSVVAWGDNSTGQSTVPAGLAGVTAIAAGDAHCLALKADGTVVAWGDNSSGQTNVPGGLNNVTAIAAGGIHSVALTSAGTVVVWGDNSQGQLNVPGGLSDVIAISAGEYHSVGLKGDGSVVAWGLNSDGQATVPNDLSGVTAIAAGGFHVLALKNDGAVVAWGSNVAGQRTLPGGLNGVTAVAAGYIHSMALKNDGTVVAWGGGGGSQTVIPDGLNGVTAIDGGYLHSIALKSNGTVVIWGNNDSGQTTIPNGLGGVTAIAAGLVHNLALVGSGQTTVTTQPPTTIGSTSVTLNGTVNTANSPSTALSFDYGLTTDYTGTTAALPAQASGTTSANTTATLSGLTPNTTYHYRAKGVNSAGTATGDDATFTTVSNAATLSGLVLSSGSLTPAFTSTTTGYTQTVPATTGSLTVKLTASHAAATLKLNDVAIASGATSAAIVLSPGLNTITAEVTAEDGTTTKSYTIGVTQLAPPIMTTLAATDPTAVGATLNGTIHALNSSTAASFEYGTTLAYGSSVAAAPATVAGSTTTAVAATLSTLAPGTLYHYRVKGVNAGGPSRGGDATFTTLSNVATLSGLVLSTGTLKPVFASATTSYTQIVPATTTSLTIMPTAASPLATISLNGAPINSGAMSGAFVLSPGLNPITVVVTAQDGVTQRSYTLNVTQLAAPVVTTLPATNLTAIGAKLNGTVNALNSSTAVSFEYGATAAYGKTAAAKPASVIGSTSTSVSATVTGLVPKTMYHYRIKGISASGTALSDDTTFTTPGNVATLAGIALSSGNLSPAFASKTLSYTATVSNATDSVTVTPTASDPNATAKVNGMAAPSGSTVALNVGINTISVAGTGEDGTTTKIYTVKVTRSPAKASLATLPASGINATSATLNGVVNTANSTSTAMSFNYGLKDTYGSTITATPSAVSGTASTGVSATPKGLKPGSTYHFRVKGVNSAGTSYGDDATFDTPSNIATLSGLVLSSGALKPGFSSKKTGYTQIVQPTTASLTVTPTATNAKATLLLNGGGIASGTTSGAIPLSPGLNTITVQVTAEDGVTSKSYIVGVTQLAAPVVETLAASNLSSVGVTFNATVNALNSSTAVTFEFGPTPAYGSTIAAKPSPVSGSTVTAVSATIGKLTPSTTYYYRVRTVSAGGTTLGGNMTFTTRNPPPILTLFALPHARVGEVYGQQVGAAAGGIEPYAFVIATAGGFPPIGIHMDGSGFLAGTPTIPGTYTFGVTVTDLTGATITRAATLIVDPLGLSITDVSDTEGNAGTKGFVFTVTLSSPSTTTVKVNYITANGTASSASDYVALPTTVLTFNPGETSKPITVQVKGDLTVEPNETFSVKLSFPVNAVIDDTQGTGTIINDDIALSAYDGLWSLSGTETTPYAGSTFQFDFNVNNGVVSYPAGSGLHNGTLTAAGVLTINAGANPSASAVISTTITGNIQLPGSGSGTFTVNSTSYGVESGTWVFRRFFGK